MTDQRVRLARALIDERCEAPLDVARLARAAGFSRYHFIRLFTSAYGETPHRYLVRRRMERARTLLASGERSVTQVCFAVGFSSVGSFSAAYRRYIGGPPRRTRADALERRRAPERFIPGCHLLMAGLARTA